MTMFRTGVEFSTNVGTLERDYQRAATASGVFGEKAQADLAGVTVAEDKVALASQRVVAAQARLAASQERLNAVMATGKATQAEMAAAQSAFVASQDRLIAAQSRQTAIIREQQAAQVATARRPTGGGGLIGVAAGLAATEAALKIKDAVEEGVRVSSQLEAINRQVDVTLASTGNVAGVTAEHIDTFSESLARTTGILPNTIAAGQLMELTFTGIRNEGAGANAIFDRAAETAANMAIGLHLARGGAIDYQGSMRMLARALNDPVGAMTILTRSGVSFTAQQRDQIKTLAESGHMLQAQQMILDLVSQKYGDAAQQFGQTAEGGFARGQVALEEFQKALAAPAMTAGVPVLHALTDALQFMADHPIAVQASEAAVAVVGIAFALASVQRAMAFLRESQWASAFLRVLFPTRSLQRQLGLLAAAEDTQAASATRNAEAVNAEAAAMERAAVAANGLAGAQGRVAATGAASAAGSAGGAVAGAEAGGVAAGVEAGAAGGLLSRSLGFVGRAAGVVGLADLIAEIGGPHIGSGGVLTGFHLAQAGNLIGQLHAETGSNGQLSDRFLRANTAQQNAVMDVYNANIQKVMKVADGGKGDLAPLRDLIKQVDEAYTKYAGDVQNTQTVWGTVAVGQHELTNVIAAQRQAIEQTDLADAQAAQRRSDRMHKALVDARTLQRQVAAGNGKAVQTVESMIGVGQAGLFDLVNPNQASARSSAASSFSSAQSSATSAQRSVVLAEARLNNLRESGKATAYQLQSAESSLASARDRAAGASDRLTTAEKKVHDAQSTSLSVADVLKRAAGQDANAQSTAEAAKRLVQLGVHRPVIAELLKLDQEAPGTFARVAAHLTKAGADELNRDQQLKNAARRSLRDAFTQANTNDAEEAARRAAHRAALAWRHGFNDTINDPSFQASLVAGLQNLFTNIGDHFKHFGGGAGGTGPGADPVNPYNYLPHTGKPLAFDTGGWVPGPSGIPRQATVHGGEYVLSRDMIAGRQPIGVGMGMHHAQTAAQQVVVHVHTAAPAYTTKHEWHNTIKADSPRDYERWADQQARARANTP